MNQRLDRGWHPRKQQAAIHQLATRIKERLTGFQIPEPALSIQLQLGRPSCYLTLMRPDQALVVRFSNHPLPEKRTKTQILSRQMPVDFMNLERALELDPERILDEIRAWIAGSQVGV